MLTLVLLPVPVTRAAEGAPHDCLAEAAPARAVEASDPRSVRLEDGRVLRLAGVESFALLRQDGDAAEAALLRRVHDLVAGRELRVALVAPEPDRYRRFPALLAGPDGELLQAVLVREGLALAFAPDGPVACFDALLAAEAEARQAGRGFWAGLSLPSARPAALRPFVGRFAIFEGVPVSVGTRPNRTYLNFGGRWSEDVTVEIEARNRDAFGGEAKLAALEGRRLRIRGFVQERGGPMVAVTSPAQIEAIGADPAGGQAGKAP